MNEKRAWYWPFWPPDLPTVILLVSFLTVLAAGIFLGIEFSR
jgi:hypothetical protein